MRPASHSASLIAAIALPTGVMAAEPVVRTVTDDEVPSMTFAPRVLTIKLGDGVISVNKITAYRDLMLKWFDEDDIPVLERQDRMRAADLDQGIGR